MKKLLHHLAILFGFNKDSKYVNEYLSEQNTRSGIFMGGIIAALEVWLIIRQTQQYFEKNVGNYSFEMLLNYDSIYILFFLIGVSIAIYCTLKSAKNVSRRLKLILNLVFSVPAFLFSFYVFYKGNYKPWNNTLDNNVRNIFLVMLYVTAMMIAAVIIVDTLLQYFKKFSIKYFEIAVIVLFAILCLTFGVRVSYTDHGRLLSEAKSVPNEIICFLTMSIYVACLLIWKPWFSIVLNVLTFLGFYFLMFAWDQATVEAQQVLHNSKTGIDYLVESFSEGDFINYITFLVSLTTVTVMIYHQRRRAALKDEELQYLADFDSLTGLHNSRYFIHEVEKFEKEHPEDMNKKIILFINLFNFKTYNDQRGFARGNLFLKEVGH